ncbi:hypothetical protein ACFX10_029678 [Malus domestica]
MIDLEKREGSSSRSDRSDQRVEATLVDMIEIQRMIDSALKKGPKFPKFIHPYPAYVEKFEYPKGFKIPYFSLFAGESSLSSLEHMARFTAWEELVEKFHEQFYRSGMEMSVSSLVRMNQTSDELPMEYLTRFKSARNWCRVPLIEVEFIKIALNGLDVEYKKKFLGANFRDMYELAQHVEQYDYLLREEKISKSPSRGTIYKNPTADAIFDQLLLAKIFKLQLRHNIPKAEELKGKTYCKYHNLNKHTTNNCVVFRDAIQSWIDKGKLKFPEKHMTVGVDPFPSAIVGMVDAHLPTSKGKGKAEFVPIQYVPK